MVAETTKQLVNRAGLAVTMTYILTFIHHIYGGIVDESTNRLAVPVILAFPLLVTLGILYLYRRTGSGIALAVYSVVAVLVWVILSGILHGGYAHAYKDLLYLLNGSPELYYALNPDEHYPPDDVFFEITGVLEMVAAFFVALYTYRLIRDKRNVRHELQKTNVGDYPSVPAH